MSNNISRSCPSTCYNDYICYYAGLIKDGIVDKTQKVWAASVPFFQAISAIHVFATCVTITTAIVLPFILGIEALPLVGGAAIIILLLIARSVANHAEENKEKIELVEVPKENIELNETPKETEIKLEKKK